MSGETLPETEILDQLTPSHGRHARTREVSGPRQSDIDLIDNRQWPDKQDRPITKGN